MEFSTANLYGILHWDAKQIKFQSGTIEDHLVIYLQKVASDKHPQFISAPEIPNGTGAAECEALVWYIHKYGIEDQVSGHVWDTTA